MKAILRGVLALCLLCWLCGAALASGEILAQTGVMKLDSGLISGEANGSIQIFRGIPAVNKGE